MDIIIQIQGRAAIPVRAIPYVTGWRTRSGIGPHELVKCLCRSPQERVQSDPFRTVSAYRLVSGRPKKVPTGDWLLLDVQMARLSEQLKREFPAGDIETETRSDAGYAAWQAGSIKLIPPETFVWLDDLERDFKRYFDWIAFSVPPESLDFPDLNLAQQVLPEDVRIMVMEGFECGTELHVCPETDCDMSSAATTKSANSGPKKRRTWRDVAWPYLVEVFNSSRYTTAKLFYQELENKAGPESPFDKGTATNRFSLYVREISENLSLKTIQNAWPEIKASRQRYK